MYISIYVYEIHNYHEMFSITHAKYGDNESCIVIPKFKCIHFFKVWYLLQFFKCPQRVSVALSLARDAASGQTFGSKITI